MPRITDVVKHLIILNVLMFLGTNIIFSDYVPWLYMHFNSPYFQPFQLVTHMFMHANFQHLIFNMFGLYMFGSAVEHAMGPKKFLFYYFSCGFGSMVLHIVYLLLTTGFGVFLGASGAIFGILAAYAMLFPDREVFLIFPPILIKALPLVLIYGAIELFLGFSGVKDGVAHFAHLGGAIFGVLLILYWRKFGTNL